MTKALLQIGLSEGHLRGKMQGVWRGLEGVVQKSIDGCAGGYRRMRGAYGGWRVLWEGREDFLEGASRVLNRITGYDVCEGLKRRVGECDENFQRVKRQLSTSRSEFAAAIASRSQCQKELNALLQRKQSWGDEELMRFTELYRTEMRLEQREAEAKACNEHLEQQVDYAHQTLMTAMRERYQEEQLWSDKIRRLSTFGTFGLMGLNLLLFLLLQMYIEPRKRQRFVEHFDELLVQRLDPMQSGEGKAQEEREGARILMVEEEQKSLMTDLTPLPITNVASFYSQIPPYGWLYLGGGAALGALLSMVATNIIQHF